MLNANEAEAAIKALVYPSGIADRNERVAAHAAYNKAVGEINTEFREWLADEYASTLPASVQIRIWGKAWEDGHADGLRNVEIHYEENADFAEFAFNAGKAATKG